MAPILWESNVNNSNYQSNPSTSTQTFNSTHQLLREELIRANKSKYERLIEFLGPGAMKKGKGKKGGKDLRGDLMLLLEVVLAELDEEILDKIKDLQGISKKMKRITKSGHERRPGKLNGLNVDSSVELQKLTMKVQQRQRLIETITNAFKSLHDTDMNSVRRIV